MECQLIDLVYRSNRLPGPKFHDYFYNHEFHIALIFIVFNEILWRIIWLHYFIVTAIFTAHLHVTFSPTERTENIDSVVYFFGRYIPINLGNGIA